MGWFVLDSHILQYPLQLGKQNLLRYLFPTKAHLFYLFTWFDVFLKKVEIFGAQKKKVTAWPKSFRNSM